VLVAVASLNPVKLEAARSAFSAAFGEVEVAGSEPPPGLAPQPMSMREILLGSSARASWACASVPGADYCVGIESGAVELEGEWYAATAATVRSRSGRQATGFGPAYPIPRRISSLMISEGLEMEEAMERLYGVPDLGRREGAVGLLSRGASSRLELCAEAVKMALLPFISPGDYRRRLAM
jgi:inosine/xanthosine triphosphatase